MIYFNYQSFAEQMHCELLVMDCYRHHEEDIYKAITGLISLYRLGILTVTLVYHNNKAYKELYNE